MTKDVTAHMRLRTVSLGDIVSGMGRTVWEVGMSYALDDGKSPVNILMASDGGEVFEGFAVENAIRDIQSALNPGVPVVGVVAGNCFSMASYVLQACRVRYCAPNAWLMVHGISQKNFSFDEKDGERNMELLRELRERLAYGYAGRSTRSRDFWDTMLKDNSPNYFTAKESLELGLIDAIR